jgi:nitroimidazol reductase NimA-like FMN-containing flavoprotein (pyridoxamine 5'-phosphate oxidase superfamily)
VSEPRADRPHVPGYGIPRSTKGTLPWSWAIEHLERATIYWLATAGASGAPHMIPIWGAWVDGRWYVEGGPTRWQRNLRENPQLAVHIESPSGEVVIVEGPAVEIVAPDAELAARILAGFEKYKPGYAADAANWAQGGLWELRPLKAFAWTTFPQDMTRYRFDEA